MKLKTAIRGRLVNSCCHFRQPDRCPSPNPVAVLYGPGPMVNKWLKHFEGGTSILTGAAFLDFSESVNPLTNCMRAKPSLEMLHSQSNLCIQGDKHCDSDRQWDVWASDNQKNNSVWSSWRANEFSPSHLDFWPIQKAIYWWKGFLGVHEWSNWNLTWGGKRNRNVIFQKLLFFILRCTIKSYFIYFHYFIFKCSPPFP